MSSDRVCHKLLKSQNTLCQAAHLISLKPKGEETFPGIPKGKRHLDIQWNRREIRKDWWASQKHLPLAHIAIIFLKDISVTKIVTSSCGENVGKSRPNNSAQESQPRKTI